MRQKTMAPLPHPDKVSIPFDVDVQQPFLLRPLTIDEIRVLREWKHFYRTDIFPSGNAVSDFTQRFYDHLKTRGFIPKQLRPDPKPAKNPRIHAELLFQNLFPGREKITVYPAVTQLMGFYKRPSHEERIASFNALIDHHRKVTQSDELPTWNDFERYHQQRVWLANVGMYAPATDFLIGRYQDFYTGNHIQTHYRAFCEGRTDVTQEQIDRLGRREVTVNDLIDNYNNVNKWIHELCPTLPDDVLANAIDVDMYAEQALFVDTAIPWSSYRRWFEGKLTPKDIPEDAEPSLGWIREQCGLLRTTEPRQGLRAANMPKWTPLQIRRGYFHTWRCVRPEGFDLGNGLLIDPPTTTELKHARYFQGMAIDQNGKLNLEECRRLNVPATRIPDDRTLALYPGGVVGLLNDIAHNDGGPKLTIAFSKSNTRQSPRLARAALRNGFTRETLPTFLTRSR